MGGHAVLIDRVPRLLLHFFFPHLRWVFSSKSNFCHLALSFRLTHSVSPSTPFPTAAPITAGGQADAAEAAASIRSLDAIRSELMNTAMCMQATLASIEDDTKKGARKRLCFDFITTTHPERRHERAKTAKEYAITPRILRQPYLNHVVSSLH